MLTEGWDTNTVTHILGVRAFGTQLLCEQVIGRALRRLSYEPGETRDPAGHRLLDAEYADILGIPFDFAIEPVKVKKKPPRPVTHVFAVKERAALAIRFPRVAGYRPELPEDRFDAHFTEDSRLVLDPSLVGPSKARLEWSARGTTSRPRPWTRCGPRQLRCISRSTSSNVISAMVRQSRPIIWSASCNRSPAAGSPNI
jgi:hypothetical protein